MPAWSDEHLHALLSSLLVPSDWVHAYFSDRPPLQDAGDEMVIEAAINGHADIVTFNRRHFRPAAWFGIDVLRPAKRTLKAG